MDSDLGGEQVYGLVFRSESNSTVFQYSFPFKIARKTTEMGTSAVQHEAPCTARNCSSPIATPTRDHTSATVVAPVVRTSIFICNNGTNHGSPAVHTTVDGAAQTQPPTRPITVLTPATGKPSILATPVPHITSEATSIGYSVLLFSGLIIALLNV